MIMMMERGPSTSNELAMLLWSVHAVTTEMEVGVELQTRHPHCGAASDR